MSGLCPNHTAKKLRRLCLMYVAYLRQQVERDLRVDPALLRLKESEDIKGKSRTHRNGATQRTLPRKDNQLNNQEWKQKRFQQ